MPVPERVPLPATHDRTQRVVLQKQYPARGHPRYPAGERTRLVPSVHQAETVEDHISRLPLVYWREPAARQQPEPRAAVRAAIFRHPVPPRQQTCRRNPLHGVRRLGHQRRRFHTLRLLRHRGVGNQLSQTARRAQPHLQRVHGIGTAVVATREIVARRLLAQVKH